MKTTLNRGEVEQRPPPERQDGTLNPSESSSERQQECTEPIPKDNGNDQSAALDIRVPNENDRYQVNDLDVSSMFYGFQRHVQDLICNQSLYYETHVQHILALSSILLVKPKCLDHDLKKYINRQMIDNIARDLGLNEYQFNPELATDLLRIVNDVLNKKDRYDAAEEVLALKTKATKYEKKILLSFAFMLNKLPDDTMMGQIMEMELISRFVGPALEPLFDDFPSNTILRWTNTIDANNTDMKPNMLISRRRPDSVISLMDGAYYINSIGYGEVKCQSQATNNHATALDLIRLGVFSKNNIDNHKHAGVLSFQVIGRQVTFYVTKLLNDGLYVMLDIGFVELPGSINDMLSYVGHLNKILAVLHVFYDKCLPESCQKEATRMESRKRSTLATPELKRFVASSKDRKRRCMTSYYQ